MLCQLRLALRDDASPSSGPTRRDIRAAAPDSPGHNTPSVASPTASPESIQSAEISESRLVVDWEAPSLLSAGASDNTYAGVLFGGELGALSTRLLPGFIVNRSPSVPQLTLLQLMKLEVAWPLQSGYSRPQVARMTRPEVWLQFDDFSVMPSSRCAYRLPRVA